MSEPTTWALVLKTAPIWYGIVRGFLSERVTEAGKDLVQEGIQEGAKSGIITAFNRLRDPEGKSFSEAFENAGKSFLARYELDRDLAKSVIRILHHAQEKQLHELNRDVLIATIFSDTPRVAPIERYCQRVIGFDQIVAGSVETYSITEISRALRYFFEELQRELMLRGKWRDVVVQFRSLQLQAKIAGEFDPLDMRREYLAYLRDRYQFLDLRGFSPRVSGREISLRLKEIFTDLELEEGRPYVSKYAEDELATMTGRQFFELDWERQLDLLEKRYVRLEATKPKVQLLKLSDVLASRKVVILGEPGSGKTTLTRYLAFAMASNDYSRTGRAVEGLVPILVRVADYGRVLDKDPTLHLIDYICQELTSDFGPLLKQELEYGQCLVMLDGLDEVAEVGQRQRVAERIEDMVATCSKNRFLVTSRPIGYQSAQLAADFRHVTLRPLTEKEQEQFVRFWYKEIRARGAGKAEGAKWFEEPEALIRALKTKPGVVKLASNPLLLTIIVLMYWRGTKLPDRRVDIYASATETLIENWPLRQRGIDLDLEQIKSILAPVALAVLSSSVSGVIAERNLDSLLLEIVREVHGGTRAEVQIIRDRMLRDLSEHSGIFLERGRDEFDYPVYGFLHQTFGEYLAAVALAERWNVGELELASYIHKERWREVTLLLAGVLGTQGRAVASQFINEILALKSPFEEILHRDLLFVLECLGDDLRIKPILRKEILRRGVKLLEHEVFELRSAALDRIKRLKGTDHAATAIELLKELLEKAKSQPKGVRRDETRLAAAEALCELGDLESAKPIIWEISEDAETFRNIVGQVQGAVTKLRVLYWTHESLEWLANLFCTERRFRPRLLVGKSLSETFIRTADGTDIPIFDHLKDDELTALFDMLYECVSEEDIRQRVKWARRIQGQSSIDVKKLLELANPQIDRQICFLAASQLIDVECTQEGIDALQSLCSGIDDQALAATQRLLDLGEPISELRAVRELAAFSDSPEGVQLARKLTETEEKSLGVAILLLGVTKEDSPKVQWEAAESLLELGLGDLGLAAAKYIACTPGHNSRYQATEALLDAQREIGRFDEVIEILVDLAYDSYGLDREKAIARLATFHETEKIAPILSRASLSSDATSQYQMARALVLGGMSEVPAGGSIEEILAQRIRRLPEKNTAFCQCRHLFLKLALDFIDDQLANHGTTDGLIHGIRAVILHESGEYPEAEELLSYVSGSYEHHGDVSLFVAHTWLNWGCPDKAFVVASKVLTESEASPTIKMFAMDLISRMLLETTNKVLLEVVTSSDNSNVQIRAVKNLRGCTDPEVISALHAILQTNPHDYRIRESLVKRLGEATIPENKEILLKALNDDVGSVRAAAANALSEFGSEEVIANLLNALADPDERVRIAASQAIQDMNVPVSADALGQTLLNDTSVEVQINTALALSMAKPDEAKPYLLRALASEVDYVRDTALRSIQQLEGSRAIPILIEGLQNPSLSQKSKASFILSLAKLADKGIADIFPSFLDDRSQEVSIAAIRALGIQGCSESTQQLCEIVARDSSVETTVAAIKSLGQLKEDSAIPILLQAISHQHEEVRKAAVMSLSAAFLTSPCGTPELMQRLRELLMKDQSSDVRRAVVTGLSWAEGAFAREILSYALLDESQQVRQAAAHALGILGDESSMSVLCCALYDSDTAVRSAAARSLGLLGFTDSLEILRLALRHQQEEVRTGAALALGRIGDVSVAHDIKNQIFGGSIYSTGCLALSYMRSDVSIACLEELLKFGNLFAKRKAARCLARVAPEALLEAIEDPFIARTLKLHEISARAQALHYAGESNRASAAYEEALAAFLDANYRVEIGMLTSLIIDSFELGYYSQCVNLLKKAIKLAPRDPVLRFNLGIAYRIMREYDLSLNMYQESLRLNPFGSIEVSNGLGILSYVRGEEEQAMEHFNSSLQLSLGPDFPGTFERYWNNAHSIHMLTVALAGAGHGDVALQRLQSVMPVMRWEPGVITEILWDIEQLGEVNSSLPALPEILALLRTTQAKLEKQRRGPLG